MKIWKEIIHVPNYEVSNLGNIKISESPTTSVYPLLDNSSGSVLKGRPHPGDNRDVHRYGNHTLWG